MKKTVLVLSPHADDSELGMGGTVAKHVRKGDDVYVVCMATHRNDDIRIAQFESAVKTLGATPLEALRGKFNDGKVGESMADLVSTIDDFKNKIKPDILYLPYPSIHQDHIAVYEAGLRSARISLSDRQWFIPNVLVYREPVSQIDVYATGLKFDLFSILDDADIKRKMDAVECHKSEILPYPHPSSPKYLEYEARNEGGKCGVMFAEAFAAVRMAI